MNVIPYAKIPNVSRMLVYLLLLTKQVDETNHQDL